MRAEISERAAAVAGEIRTDLTVVVAMVAEVICPISLRVLATQTAKRPTRRMEGGLVDETKGKWRGSSRRPNEQTVARRTRYRRTTC